MSTVDQVTQRNASAAEELSSTAEEMASQAESLQQLVSFFLVQEHAGAARFRTGHAPHPADGHAPRPTSGHAPHTNGAAAGAPAALPARANGAAHADGGFKRF
jgi:methyl-accepting chemotaxis protein